MGKRLLRRVLRPTKFRRRVISAAAFCFLSAGWRFPRKCLESREVPLLLKFLQSLQANQAQRAEK